MYKIYGLTNKCPQLQFSVFADAVVSISLNLLPMIAALIVAICSVAQSCLILCDLEDYNPSGSSVHGISQERVLEWAVTFFFRGSSRPRD